MGLTFFAQLSKVIQCKCTTRTQYIQIHTDKTKSYPVNKNQIRCLFQDPSLLHFNPIVSPTILSSTPQTSNSPATQSSLTPHFLSRFPRSLSSLSLGGKKKTTEKDAANANIVSQASPNNTEHLLQAAGLHHHSSHNALLSSMKSKFCSEAQPVELRPGFVDKNRSKQPPPLPLRNFTRRSQPPGGDTGIDASDASDPIALVGVKKKGKSSADNDNKSNNNEKSSGKNTSSNGSMSASSAAAAAAAAAASSNKVKKRSKAKIKANSDPKISAQLFIQMEREYDKQDLIAATGHCVANEPPPLPPRQPGMLEENQNMLNNNKCGANARHENRPAANSLDTRMNYPLIATATAVRDNISPFPLSNRPNIRQRLQQQSNTHQHVSNRSSTSNKHIHKIHKNTHAHTRFELGNCICMYFGEI